MSIATKLEATNVRRFIVQFTVRPIDGWRPFPIDMLRYDCCAPMNEGDAAAIEARNDPDSRDVREIRLVRFATNSGWRPTADRWRSFGWTVL